MIDLKKFKNQGKYLMLALDHRGSFRRYINPSDPGKVTDNVLIKTKAMIIEALEDQFSGVLLDPDWGMPAYKSKNKPYLLCLEKTGYVENDGEKITELQYSARQLKEWGASGVKLLIYFNPEAKSARQQIKTAQTALADSHKNKLPLFLEIVTYGDKKKNNRSELVLDSVKMFLKNNIAPDVWKLEYPGNKKSCEKITGLVGKTPWILLTGGATYKVFVKQLQDAVAAGAVGFLAGRALWQEISDYKTEADKKEFLNTVVADRFRKISKVVLGK